MQEKCKKNARNMQKYVKYAKKTVNKICKQYAAKIHWKMCKKYAKNKLNTQKQYAQYACKIYAKTLHNMQNIMICKKYATK